MKTSRESFSSRVRKVWIRLFSPAHFHGKVAEDKTQDKERVAEAQEMIQGVKELSEKTVKDVMVPRIDTSFLPLQGKKEELLDKVVNCGHSRIPVYGETIDNVLGILYVKDLLRYLVNDTEFNLSSIIRKPFFVPESKRIDALLREFRRRKVHIAVVIDEYGGVSGIVCLEDIIEEIVGEIQDEYDEETEDIQQLGESSWLCDARLDLDDINQELGLHLPSEDFDTLGGYVFALFGKIPIPYESTSSQDIDYIVQSMDGNRITTVKLVKNSPGSVASSSGHKKDTQSSMSNQTSSHNPTLKSEP